MRRGSRRLVVLVNGDVTGLHSRLRCTMPVVFAGLAFLAGCSAPTEPAPTYPIAPLVAAPPYGFYRSKQSGSGWSSTEEPYDAAPAPRRSWPAPYHPITPHYDDSRPAPAPAPQHYPDSPSVVLSTPERYEPASAPYRPYMPPPPAQDELVPIDSSCVGWHRLCHLWSGS